MRFIVQWSPRDCDFVLFITARSSSRKLYCPTKENSKQKTLPTLLKCVPKFIFEFQICIYLSYILMATMTTFKYEIILGGGGGGGVQRHRQRSETGHQVTSILYILTCQHNNSKPICFIDLHMDHMGGGGGGGGWGWGVNATSNAVRQGIRWHRYCRFSLANIIIANPFV